MTPAGVRLLRRALLGSVVVVSTALVWTWRGGHAPPPASPGPTVSPGASAAPRTENLVFKSFKGQKQSFSLAAREMVGQEQEEVRLKGVDFTFSYVSQGQAGTGTIKADACLYNPSQQKSVFEGAVHMTTSDGFELRTESLTYRGDKEVARSEAPVEFQRGSLSGRSRGFHYESQSGRLELPAQVFVRTENAQGPPTEITATRAELAREEGTMRFLEGVEVVQGDQRLVSRTFEVDFGEDKVIYRARAIEQVRVTIAGGPLPGTTTAAPSGAKGPRQLSCRKLDMWLRPGGLLQELTATQDADLVLLPARGEPSERRHLRSDVIQFIFDEAGKLSELRTARGTTFEATPLSRKKGAPPARTLSCQRLLAKMDPSSGEVSVIEFEGNLVFAQGKQKATAQKAYYDGTNLGLYLVQDPELTDEEQGSQLKAQAIDIATRSGDLAAREDVRHVVRGAPGRRASGLLGGEAPLQLSSRRFAYEAASHTGRYTEQALLRSGRDEVRGGEIVLQEKDGQRRLEARGGVVALLHPKGEGQPGQPLDARAAEMKYEEAQHRAVFRGQVTMHQGDMQTRSPEATLTLDAQGSGLESLVAGSPVEVTFGQRQASGARATYAPQAGTLTIVGEHVHMKDPEQEVQGQSLTLHLGDDRILIDGREVRTQTIIRGRKEPPRP